MKSEYIKNGFVIVSDVIRESGYGNFVCKGIVPVGGSEYITIYDHSDMMRVSSDRLIYIYKFSNHIKNIYHE